MTTNKTTNRFQMSGKIPHEISEKGHPFVWVLPNPKWHSSLASTLYKISVDREPKMRKREMGGIHALRMKQSKHRGCKEITLNTEKILEEISLTTAFVAWRQKRSLEIGIVAFNMRERFWTIICKTK